MVAFSKIFIPKNFDDLQTSSVKSRSFISISERAKGMNILKYKKATQNGNECNYYIHFTLQNDLALDRVSLL